MKIKRLSAVAAIILCVISMTGCDRTLRDTSKGNLTVSFRVNGDMFKCEYVKVGLPLQILMGVVMVIVLPLLFPF